MDGMKPSFAPAPFFFAVGPHTCVCSRPRACFVYLVCVVSSTVMEIIMRIARVFNKTGPTTPTRNIVGGLYRSILQWRPLAVAANEWGSEGWI